MKVLSSLRVGAWTLVVLAAGCGQETMDGWEEQVGAVQQAAVCSNDQATFAVMASMANGAAKDLRRWLPKRDMQWNSTSGKLELTAFGRARCPVTPAGVKECKAMNSLLQLQND